MEHLCSWRKREGGGGERSEVGTGWGDAGFMLGGTEGVFPAARPLRASCRAVMLYRPTRGAVRRWGGAGVPAVAARTQSHSDGFALHAL